MDNAIVLYNGTSAITFKNYDEILNQARQLAEHVSSVVVTEETVKATKKLLAEVNKRITELEDERKLIKKAILSPYDEFEEKVKSITSVVKEAERIVREQVKELEEQERSVKQEEIVTIFGKRMKREPLLNGLFTALDFIKPQHLNKSTSITKVEAEMVEWIGQRKVDIEYIKGLDHSDDILVEYKKCQHLIQSINLVQERYKVKEQIKQPNKPADHTATIVINGKDLERVKQILQLSNVEFTVKGE